MTPEQFADLERYCQALYKGVGPDRETAHNVLLPLIGDAKNVPQLQFIIDNSAQEDALVFAALGLHKLVTAQWSQVPQTQREDLKKFLLNYLQTKGDQVQKFACQAISPIIRLFVRLVKLSWLDDPANQNITESIDPFLRVDNMEYFALGIEIYTELAQDMQPATGASISRYRRTALSFRDSALPKCSTPHCRR